MKGESSLNLLLSGDVKQIRLSIVDMRGGVIWSRDAEMRANEFFWDGRAEDGRPVAAGMYVLRASLEGANHPARILEKQFRYSP